MRRDISDERSNYSAAAVGCFRCSFVAAGRTGCCFWPNYRPRGSARSDQIDAHPQSPEPSAARLRKHGAPPPRTAPVTAPVNWTRCHERWFTRVSWGLVRASPSRPAGTGTVCGKSGTPARRKTAKGGRPTSGFGKLYHDRPAPGFALGGLARYIACLTWPARGTTIERLAP